MIDCEAFLAWYEEVHRDLPWRRDRDPYHVWVSEIMLQQTRVEAVIPYYHRFLGELPDPVRLAECPEDKLLKLWEGLGYYSRVRNMRRAAQMICRDFGGKMPADYGQIRALPGIGDYTAGAVASIAFGIPVPAVDGNVLRVTARWLRDSSDIMLAKTRNRIRAYLQELIPVDEPGKFNQALMELGATVCIPGAEPRCGQCPARDWCLAHQCGEENKLPVRGKKSARRIEERTVLVIGDTWQVLLRRRPSKGLLAGMYEYPVLEGTCSEEEVLAYVSGLGVKALRIKPLPHSRHLFTHVEWQMTGYQILAEDLKDSVPEDGLIIAAAKDLIEIYAVPSAYRTYTMAALNTMKTWE